MPGLINIANGLSAMGGSIAQTAGDGAILSQKQQLEEQSMRLADQLTTTRETALEGQRESFATKQQQAGFTQQTSERKATEDFRVGPEAQAAKDLAKYTSDLSVDADRQKALDVISNIPKVAEANRQADIDNASNPKWVQAKKTIADATATAEQRAQASYYLSEASKNSIQTAAIQEAQDARTALSTAMQGNDPAAVRQAQSRLAVAEYSSHDEVARASALNQAATNSRMEVESIRNKLATQKGNIGGAATAEQKQELDALERELSLAEDAYKTTSGMALNAARELPNFNDVIKPARPPNAPPLASFDRGVAQPAQPAPARQSPKASYAPPRGIINSQQAQ